MKNGSVYQGLKFIEMENSREMGSHFVQKLLDININMLS